MRQVAGVRSGTTGEGGPLEPAAGATLGAALRHAARVRPDHCLVDVDGRRLTFAGADDRADRLAAVHAIPATDGEDEIKACVVAREGVRLEPAPLFDHCRDQLPYVTEQTWDLLALGYEVPRAERR